MFWLRRFQVCVLTLATASSIAAQPALTQQDGTTHHVISGKLQIPEAADGDQIAMTTSPWGRPPFQSVEDDGDSFRLTTNSPFFWHAGTTDGHYQASGFVGHAELRDLSIHGMTVELEAAERLTVRVVDQQGQPVPSAKVRLNGMQIEPEGVTDQSGKATLQVPSKLEDYERRQVVAWTDDHRMAARSIDPFVDDQADRSSVSLELLPTRPHIVELKDEGGSPVANVEVQLNVRGDNLPFLGDCPLTRGSTDESGQFTARVPSQTPAIALHHRVITNDWYETDSSIGEDRSIVVLRRMEDRAAFRGRVELPQESLTQMEN